MLSEEALGREKEEGRGGRVREREERIVRAHIERSAIVFVFNSILYFQRGPTMLWRDYIS